MLRSIELTLSCVALAALLVACKGDEVVDSDPSGGDDSGQPQGDDSDDPFTYDGPTEITNASAGCDTRGRWFDIEATGLVSAATASLENTFVTTRYNEMGHPFPALAPYSTAPGVDDRGYHADDGSWSHPYLNLAFGDTVLGQETNISCMNDDEMTYQLTIWDAEGQPADCVSFGHDPTDRDGDVDFSACRAI